jgi:hypothetical protein
MFTEESDLPSHSQVNNDATSLFVNCSLHDTPSYSDAFPIVPSPFQGFGVAPPDWQLRPGPVIIARADQRPLHILHAAALIAFSTHHLGAKFKEYSQRSESWSIVSADDPVRHELDVQARKDVLASITKANFQSFFKAYKAKRVAGIRDPFERGFAWSWDLEEAFDLWEIPLEERAPRPDWKDVPNPYDVI